MFLTFDKHTALRADSRALANTGKTIAARMPIIAITTSSSIKVKPLRRFICVSPELLDIGYNAAISRRAELPTHLLPLVCADPVMAFAG
jgi:hypothetical protein